MKINYVIATWSGDRVKPVNREYYLNVLKNHLKVLSNTENNINQITIMKPKNNIQNRYYNIELTDKIKVVECENRFQSYGQYLQALEIFINDFDYFIFIEDDYVPATSNFDTKLIELYEEGSYLGAQLNVDDMSHPYAYCSISNGIISSNSVRKIIKTIDYNEWLLQFRKRIPDWTWNGRNYQIAFSRYFLENGIVLKEYAKKYCVDFFVNGEIINRSYPELRDAEKLFTPIQNMIK